MARLGDIFTIMSGGTPDKKKSEYYANGTIPWVKTGDLKNQYVPTGIECITEEGLNNSSAKLFPPNTVLVAMYGATIGACSILPYEASTNQACAAFLPNEKVMPTYLYYFLSSKKEQFIKDGVGGAQPNISAGYLKNVQFDLIPMQQQINMVRTLDKVSELITLRKEQLAKLEQLVKSRFIELFGDPIRNTQNRPTTDFINVVKMQRGFDLPVQDRQQNGKVPVFGSNGALDRHNVAKVQGGGVITGRSGTIGKVYYTEGDYWPLNTSLFSVDTHGNNIIYLAYLLQMYDLSRFTEGTGVPTLNRNKFHDKPIIDVPLNEQKQFAVFVKQTDKSKLAIQQSLDKLETLKKSLMQEYFG